VRQHRDEFVHRHGGSESAEPLVIVVIGYIAAVIDVGQFAPQLWRTIRRRNEFEAMKGLSIVTYLIATAQAILWIIYGFATDRLPIGLPNLFIAPACAYILLLALRARWRKTSEVSGS
jgi:uncharacterized protein with PQ loop repeat